jgi:signal transduction histidine kinase
MLTILLGLGFVGLLTSFLVKEYIYDTKQEELLRMAARVNQAIHDYNVNDETRENMLVFFDESYNARIWVFDKQGEIITTSLKDEVHIGKSVSESIVRKVMSGESVVNDLKLAGLSEPMLSVAVPWGKDDNVYGGIVVHSSVSGINDTVRNIRETILWGILIGIIFSTMMVSYLSWSISRPLQKIDSATSEIGLGNYSKRIEIDSTDEIGDLAKTINTMADKLEIIDQERNKLDQIRMDFLANVSHELKTPLTAIQGFLEALQEGFINEEARPKYYDIMYHETLHMNTLLDDIMDWIKLKNRDIALVKGPIDVNALLHKIFLKFDNEAEKKNIKLIVQKTEELPKLHGDEDRIEQILSNIIMNAIKFTEHGNVTLYAKKEVNNIVFIIKDTGIGISKTDQELIWERFFKVDRGRMKTNKGTGLGLAIVKELVELFEGKITVNSEVNKGTTFRIEIPIEHT